MACLLLHAAQSSWAASAHPRPRLNSRMTVASPDRTTPTHCPYCALQCGMHLTGTREAPSVMGNVKFPVNRGGLCIKGWSAGATLAHPDRLLTPLVRGRDG